MFRLEQEDAFCSSRKGVPGGSGKEVGLEAEENIFLNEAEFYDAKIPIV